MGRIYDALRRAEQERQRGPGRTSEPAVVLGPLEPAGPAAPEAPSGTPLAGSRPSTRVEPDGAGADPAAAAVGPSPDVGPPLVSPAPFAPNGAGVRPAAALVAVASPSSPAAEHLRAVRSRILRTFEEHGYRSLLVTSPGRAEGKSTIAANLALLLAAEINRRAILIDGDIRKPSVDRFFGVPSTPGLSDVALGRVLWPQVTSQAPWNGLTVLPAGSRVDTATELLNGPAARQFLRDVRAAYDFVVIDGPPVLPVADAVVLAGLVDAVLLVARAEQTPREALAEAVDALAKARLVGVVLNALPRRPLTSYRTSYYY